MLSHVNVVVDRPTLSRVLFISPTFVTAAYRKRTDKSFAQAHHTLLRGWVVWHGRLLVQSAKLSSCAEWTQQVVLRFMPGCSP